MVYCPSPIPVVYLLLSLLPVTCVRLTTSSGKISSAIASGKLYSAISSTISTQLYISSDKIYSAISNDNTASFNHTARYFQRQNSKCSTLCLERRNSDHSARPPQLSLLSLDLPSYINRWFLLFINRVVLRDVTVFFYLLIAYFLRDVTVFLLFINRVVLRDGV